MDRCQHKSGEEQCRMPIGHLSRHVCEGPLVDMSTAFLIRAEGAAGLRAGYERACQALMSGLDANSHVLQYLAANVVPKTEEACAGTLVHSEYTICPVHDHK